MAVQCDTFMWPSLDLTYHCMSNSDVPTPRTSLDLFPVATRNTHFGHIYSSFPPPSQHQQSLDSDPHAEKTTISESRDKDLTQSPFIFGQARILSGEIMFIYSKACAQNPPKGRVLTCAPWFPDTKKRNRAIRTSGSSYNVRSSSSIPSFHLKLTRMIELVRYHCHSVWLSLYLPIDQVCASYTAVDLILPCVIKRL